MLLFKKPFWAGLVDGSITLTFRRWQRPHVRPGGRYRCHPIGVLEVDAIDRVLVGDITDEEARRAGLADRAALLAYMAEGASDPPGAATAVWRVALRHVGDGDRVPLAMEAALAAADVTAIRERLAAFDERSAAGRWTARALALIERHPRVAASQLAARIGWETAPFKANVVKLKKLGLTLSFEVGYELSPRGRAFRAAAASPARGPRGGAVAPGARRRPPGKR